MDNALKMPYATVPASAIKKPSPFRISIPQKDLDDFKILLQLSKVAAPTFESLQEDRRFGVSHKWISETKKYWEEKYDWKKFEDRINFFPQFTSKVTVDKVDHTIHFTALFSENTNAIPIVLLHGWPGNFTEFLSIFSLIQAKYTPETLPYHLIVPSLPGYAFSTRAPLDRELGVVGIAAVINQLMLDLGFGSGYVAQGGDIGSRVCRVLGDIYPSCKAIHTNLFILTNPPKDEAAKAALTETERKGRDRADEFLTTGSAYALEHATRPSTIGFVLAANPISLLAWIGEKFLTWTDEDPSLDEILNHVTLYWLTESFPGSIYTYRGRFLPQPQPGTLSVKAPTGHSYFAKELMPAPKRWIEKEANLVFFREHQKGGHFAAIEQPEVLLQDLEDFVAQVWKK